MEEQILCTSMLQGVVELLELEGGAVIGLVVAGLLHTAHSRMVMDRLNSCCCIFLIFLLLTVDPEIRLIYKL